MLWFWKHATTLATLTQFNTYSVQGLMLCKFRAATSQFFFHWKQNFHRIQNWREVVADQCCAHHFAKSFYHWFVSEQKNDIGTKPHVPNWILCKAAGVYKQLVRKGCLLRFESNSAATSDGSEQKLWNNVWRDSKSIATKVCSQFGSKWNVMFESHVVTSVDSTSFDFQFEDFFSNLPL